MIGNNEKKLLDFIKYSPIIFISIVALMVNILVFFQNNINFEKNIQKDREHFIETQKVLVKKEVEKVYDNILLERADIENNLKSEIKQKVYEAHAIVTNLYANYKHLGKKEVLKIIKEALRDVRFNEGRGYYFIDDINGIKQLQPINPEFEGQNYLEFKDARGYQFVKTISQTIKNKSERFDEYHWPKPGSEKAFKKISFYKTFEPLNFAIGAGEYLDDFTKNVQKHLLMNRIKKVSFGKNGYIFVTKYDGTYITHIKDSYIGVNRINLTDKNGFEITKEIIKKAKEGEGFISYIGTIMPQTGLPAQKTTYIKGLNDWSWAIGAGFYEAELNATLIKKESELKLLNEEYTQKIFLISILLSLFLIFISIYISRILKKYFLRYNRKISEQIEENRKKENLLYQQSKMAAMGEMLANIAHQWRQPLSVITTISTSMKIQKELGVNDEKTEINYLDNITKNAEYLSHTIDDFRDFFKTDKSVVFVNIKDVIDKTFLLLNSKLKDKNIDIVQSIEKVMIKTVENELIQILINIINNAEDALCNNTIKVIVVTVTTDDENLIIKIKDNAGGIEDEVLSRIFEPYFTTKHKSQGTGLGLYMVKEIVTRHMSGTIDVLNNEFIHNKLECKGAEFTITLPKNFKE